MLPSLIRESAELRAVEIHVVVLVDPRATAQRLALAKWIGRRAMNGRVPTLSLGLHGNISGSALGKSPYDARDEQASLDFGDHPSEDIIIKTASATMTTKRPKWSTSSGKLSERLVALRR